MNTIIGVLAQFLTENHKEKILAAAKNYGYLVKNINPELQGSDLADCAVLFGLIPTEQLKLAKKLVWYHTAMAGVDKIVDTSLYASPTVLLTNSAGAYGVTIAEHLLALLLVLMRNLGDCVLNQAQSVWGGKKPIRSIFGSTITVVGLGDIGSNFAQRVHALGAKVIGVRKSAQQKPDYLEALYTADKLDEALKNADVVMLSVPATAETAYILSASRIAALKKGCLVLNVGRGSAIDQQALCDALNSEHLGGAGLDVTVPEPLPQNNPLWKAKNCLITPHLAGNTTLAHTCDSIVNLFLDNLHNYAQGKQFSRAVDRIKGY